MKLEFRQGIVRCQIDGTGNPSFLTKESDGSISILAFTEPVIVTFAHGTADYLFEETNNVESAWSGFDDTVDQWLYWDLDPLDGHRTFGTTTLEPVASSSAPESPEAGQHWFDSSSAQMKVWNGAGWVVKIRVFAAKLASGSSIEYPYSVGASQGNLQSSTYAGYILFDDNDHAIRKYNARRAGVFMTTESPISTQMAKLANLRIETSMPEGIANQTIPQWSAVAFTDGRELSAASYNKPQYPAVGIANEAMSYGEARAFVNAGYIEDPNWNWNYEPGTPVFYDDSGQLTTQVPDLGAAQQVATVISPTMLLVNVREPIYYG